MVVMVMHLVIANIVFKVIYSPGKRVTPLPHDLEMSNPKEFRKHSFRGRMEGCHARAARKKQTQKFLGLINEEPLEIYLVA